jgi:hypothetical protein
LKTFNRKGAIMANRLYFTIIRVYESPGKGSFELHNSIKRKDLTTGRPDKLAKSIRYYDKGSFRVAVEVLKNWRHELKDRFSAIEVEPKRPVWIQLNK